LLLGLLATGRVRALAAACAGLFAAVVIAILIFRPQEVDFPDSGGMPAWATTVLAAALNGAAFGLFPIGWIVLSAIFLYSLTVETGQFDVVKHSVLALSDDRRIQALLIAFCFGAFIEGAAGFGTPVAISAALLRGAGFQPLQAAVLALVANTSPVAFGALGIPIVTLANVTGLSELQLSAMAGRQLPFFSCLIPCWLVWMMAGWRGVVGIWPALAVTGGSFAIVQFLISNYHGPWLVDVVGGLISMLCLALLLRLWQPASTWHFPGEVPEPRASMTYTRRQIASAWLPWVLLTALVFLWGLPQVKATLGNMDARDRSLFDSSKESLWIQPTTLTIKVPALHRVVARDFPVVASREEEKAFYDLNWLSATGSGIFLAAILSAAWLRLSPRRVALVFLHTSQRMARPLATIACMLAIAFTSRYSGMDAALGLAFTRAAWGYPFLAAILGWLGVALTGSDTSSNALFGSLQVITARRLASQGALALSLPQAALLLAAANSSGGVMGKMIDAQSIVVSAAATQAPGQEGLILRQVFWHSLALVFLMGALVMLQAHLWSWMIP
jgi:lactate permease